MNRGTAAFSHTDYLKAMEPKFTEDVNLYNSPARVSSDEIIGDSRVAFSESNGDTEFDEACHSASFSSLNAEYLMAEGNEVDECGPNNQFSPNMVITSFDESTVTEEKS